MRPQDCDGILTNFQGCTSKDGSSPLLGEGGHRHTALKPRLAGVRGYAVTRLRDARLVAKPLNATNTVNPMDGLFASETPWQ
jgi:hypothetical protein